MINEFIDAYQDTEIKKDLLTILFELSFILIALTNLILAIHFFKTRNKRDDEEKEKDRKIQFLKTLVLDHNMSQFYLFFDNLEKELLRLNNPKITDLEKTDILKNTDNLFIGLSRKFTDTLIAIDKGLYDSVLCCIDNLQTEINDAVGNEGINLSHPPKYDEVITQNITRFKTSIIQKLFNYRG